MDNKSNKMLIDATHPEETRVVVLRNGRVEEFDYESAARKLLRGNIYLAKVTRVEPSLQAAFVEYGGNRHGFLAFNEIHPDYYQIPVSDRQALIDEEAAAEAEADAEADARAERRYQGGGNGGNGREGREGREGRDGRRGGRRHRSSARDANQRERFEAPGQDNAVQEGAGENGANLGDAGQDAHSHDEHGDEPRGMGTQPADQHGAPDVGSHDAPASHEAHTGEQHPEASAYEGAPDASHDAPHGHDDHHEHESMSGAAANETRAEATRGHVERVSEEFVGDDQHSADPHATHSDSEQPEGNDVHARADEGDATPSQGAPEGGNDDTHIEQVAEVTDAPETVGAGEDTGIEDEGGDDVQERPRRHRRRQYKIQEVIKRRQIILVQVVKEERGNKGAALTTYLSLAGRYTVLMPNTGRGGGISRKIVNPGDRKRLKAIAQELDVPEGMGLIIRTAGAARTSQEIKRDYEYLLRLWESVRDLTLRSTAPSLVYEEGNLIRRSIRDLYTKEIDEIVVAGDQAHTDAHDFMRMLMPSHAKHVTRYAHPEALFTRYQIERQLNAMFSPYVTLKSGGYLVINQTEALVSIDVNSGKSTREYSIEETALATNLEAADEIARQLKLRDLAGLIVIDFIDMEEKRNNRAVERRLTDALRFDRARIQVGRISHFGLLEMSRQRMRTGVLEGSTSQCPHCQGTGMIRSTESVALAVLRGLEDHLIKDARSSVNVLTTAAVALYILNNKRSFIVDIERRYGIVVAVLASERMQGANFAVERSAAPVAPRQGQSTAVSMDWGFQGEDQPGDAGEPSINEPEVINDTEADGDEGEGAARGEGGDGQRGRRRRRRRGRDRDRGERQPYAAQGGDGEPASREDDAPHETYAEPTEAVGGDDANFSDDAGEAASDETQAQDGDANGADSDSARSGRRSRRRGRRGGRRGRDPRSAQPGEAGNDDAIGEGEPVAGGEGDDAEPRRADEFASATEPEHTEDAPVNAPVPHVPHRDMSAEVPQRSHAEHADAHAGASVEHEVHPVATRVQPSDVTEHAGASAGATSPPEAAPSEPTHVPVTQFPVAPEDPSRPRRRGWWQRRGLGE